MRVSPLPQEEGYGERKTRKRADHSIALQTSRALPNAGACPFALTTAPPPDVDDAGLGVR